MPEKVILVDLNDKAIGEMEKLKAHQEAKLHRAISVIISNSQGELLLQKRALEKYHSPGLWTNTACTHPLPGERNIVASKQRLIDEMGIEANQLNKVFDFVYKVELENGLTEYEYDHVFVGISDIIPKPNPSEGCGYKYIKPDKLMKEIEKEPNIFTFWFKIIMNKLYKEFKFDEVFGVKS